MIELLGVKKNFGKDETRVEVLKGIDFKLGSEHVLISGASGEGKSTLLHIMGGLERFDEGELLIDGHKFFDLNDHEKSKLRNLKFGYVFQFHHLIPECSALENVALPLWIRGIERKIAFEKAEVILNEIGLKERLKHRPSQLSGGESQRVAVARALVGSPRVIFCDEPTGSLDRSNRDSVMDLIFESCEKSNSVLVMVSHDLGLKLRFQRHFKLIEGKLVESS